MRLYIASKHQDKAAALMAELVADGHEITARWITLDTKFSNGVESYTDSERRALALMDEEDVRAAVDGLVLIAEPPEINVPGGKHVETGIALALGRPVFVVGRRENIFHWHPSVNIFPDSTSLRAALKTGRP
jgi:hypothetical protein